QRNRRPRTVADTEAAGKGPRSPREQRSMWRIGVDVGGTFTDLFGWDDVTGRRVTAKVLTTKHDRSEGVLRAIRAAEIPFHEISHLLHGTTTATNALIERSCPDAALVT